MKLINWYSLQTVSRKDSQVGISHKGHVGPASVHEKFLLTYFLSKDGQKWFSLRKSHV